jgi:hypothetical protein
VFSDGAGCHLAAIFGPFLKVDQINSPRHCGAKPVAAVDDLWAMLPRQDVRQSLPE